jgi:hypothetical protein
VGSDEKIEKSGIASVSGGGPGFRSRHFAVVCSFALFAMKETLLESTLVCPICGFAKREMMPTGACQFFYECVSCKTLLRPKPGDCCVFCSYGSVKCPPVQKEGCICPTAE